jgi:hypothetical protein
MSQLGKLNRKTKIIASIAIFASLYTVLRMISTIPMIGVSGASFSPSDVLAPLYGIILGSYVGGASVILGTFLAIALGRPVSFMFLDFLPAAVNAVALGFLVRRKWTPAVILNAALLVVFLLNPLTSIFVTVPLGNTTISFPFAWMHIVAFAVLLSPLRRKAGQWVETTKSTRITTGIAILAFIGTMMQHLMGGILFEVVLGQIGNPPIIVAAAYPGIWTTVFFLYPWERLVLILLAVVVGTPLVKALRNSFFRFEK